MNLIKLTFTSGRVVYINSGEIRQISECDGWTEIVYKSGTSISVREKASQIAEKIQEAR
jgi:uncharacterized protein YlzI (FlbEa/FlbD family)